jgi:hypothetical protein
MFKKAAKIDLAHIPYKGGGPATVDLVAGQVPGRDVGAAAKPPGKWTASFAPSRLRVEASDSRYI